ncbi:hypothetical protein QR680_010591 [Steinernema hermaphroditum]|uniref:Major facilitator superfamily (MFS) profile domain-containing protein n=1 Tax=Steinernema hermaphroditum TaxID=289476 RepID=A0AA39IPI2_9BILA|nr:hypothetical protein QR680_010591 [Steinernema hermaphroditum]
MSNVVRYAILAISLLCMAFFIANTVLFNFTVICMNPKNRVGGPKVVTTTPAHQNFSAEELEDLNDLSGGIYTTHEEGYILSAVALGAMLGTFPSIHITEVMGLRTTFTLIGLMSGVSTFIMPLWYKNVWIVLVVRFVQGFGMACASVAIGIIPLTWGGAKEKGIFVSVLTCCYQLGPILAMPLAGVFCSSPLGWEWVYYVFGAGTIVTFLVFFLIYSNKPHKNRFANSIKVRPIREPQKLPKTKDKVPYGKIFTTMSVWGVLVTGLGDAIGYMVFVLYGPIYINKVLNFDVAHTGVLSAIPYVFSIFTKFLGGIFLDKATCISDNARVMFFTALSQVLMAVSFFGLTLLHSDTPMLAEVVFVCAIVVSGLHHIGLMGAFHIVAGKYTHVLSSVIALLDGLIGLALPRLVAFISTNHDNSEWTILFYWISGILLVTDVLFVAITRMKPAEWSGVDIQSRAKFSFRQSYYDKSEEPALVLQTIHSNGIDEWFGEPMANVLRYVILFISLVCMAFLIANTVLFNFTVICMKPKQDVQQVTFANESRYYTPDEESWLLSSVAVGSIIGTFPSIHATEKFGLRRSFALFGILSAMATVAMPLASEYFYAVVGVRFVQGFAKTAAFVAIGIIPHTWGGMKQKGLFVSMLTCSYQLGPFFATSASGFFCSSTYGWEWVYYTFGIATLICFIVFFVVYTNSPYKNRFAQFNAVLPLTPTGEKPLTHEHPKLQKTRADVPYKAIAKSFSVWGIMSTGLGDALGYQIFFLYGPIYVNKILGFDIADTGVLASTPYLISIATKFFGGIFLDKASCISDHVRVILFTVISQLGMAISFMLLTMLKSDTPILAQAVFTLTVVVSGLHHIGIMSGSHMVAQQYTHILSSGVAALDSSTGLLLPHLVALVAPHYSHDEWSHLFYGIVAVLLVTNVSFVLMTKLRPAKWTQTLPQ